MNIFCATTPVKMAEHQLKEAQMGVLEHQKAAEYHQAVADMFAKRIVRLTDTIYIHKEKE